MVAIIDYGAGNLQSVKKALDFLGYESEITMDREKILSASHVILPGVGSFGDAMASIRERGLEDIIKQAASGEKHFLGICLGLQLMFEKSDETPGVEGLGIFKGDIVKIPSENGLKVPHIGWNSINLKQTDGIFNGIKDGSYFYFVHSYYLKADHEEDVAASTFYSTNIHASIEHGNVFACQFHPEKSSTVGLQILKNFIELEA